MNCNILQLCEYEREALLEALRRDLRSESLKATTEDPIMHAYHFANARLLVRLLEHFAPRRKERADFPVKGQTKRTPVIEHAVPS